MIKTLGDRVVVRLDKSATVTEGGIHIPEAAQKEETTTGTVVATSEHGRLNEEGVFVPPEVKPGDRVLVKDWAGTEIILEGVELHGGTVSGKFHVFRESEIYAVIED